MIGDRQLDDNYYMDLKPQQHKFVMHFYDESNGNDMISIVETVLPISQGPFIAQARFYMHHLSAHIKHNTSINMGNKGKLVSHFFIHPVAAMLRLTPA